LSVASRMALYKCDYYLLLLLLRLLCFGAIGWVWRRTSG